MAPEVCAVMVTAVVLSPNCPLTEIWAKGKLGTTVRAVDASAIQLPDARQVTENTVVPTAVVDTEITLVLCPVDHTSVPLLQPLAVNEVGGPAQTVGLSGDMAIVGLNDGAILKELVPVLPFTSMAETE